MNNAAVPQKSLTTERPTFDRTNGLRLQAGELSLQRWDVDPDIVAQRLLPASTMPRVTMESVENG